MLRSLPARLRLLALFLAVACGGSGGGSGDGSIGGDAVTRGVVSATGSVTVGGTTYGTGSAEVFFDGVLGSEVDLLPGMSVRVEGQRTGDGSQGNASRVDADVVIAGPVFSDTPDMVVAGRSTLVVLGEMVQVDAGFTEFDQTDIDTGNVVVYGYPDGSGGVIATRIEENLVPSRGAIRGEVENLVTMGTMLAFDVGSVGVTVETTMTQLPDGAPAEGDVVTVNGALMGGDIEASTSSDRVAIVTDAGDVGDYELVGIISGFSSLNDPFRVDGQPVNASGLAVLFQPQTADFVDDGVLVEIEGSLVDGVVLPSVVTLRNDGGRVSAQIEASTIDDVEETLMLLDPLPPQGDGILVETDASTRYVGCAGFGDLVVGGLTDVRVVSFGTRVVATTIACDASVPPVRVVGRVQGFDGTFETVNILGLEIQIAPGAMGPGYFQGFPGTLPTPVTDAATFFSHLNSNPTVRLEVLDGESPDTVFDEADSVRWAEDD